MQRISWFLTCLILFFTYFMEKDELFITKLSHRWYTFTLVVISMHLWARGTSWKMTILHAMAIFAAISVDTSQPIPAAIGLLFQTSLSLVAMIVSFDSNRHVRSPWPPFAIQPSEGEHPMPSLAQDILAEVKFISSDDSDEDEDQLPPGYLDGPFILGPPPSPTPPPAG